MDKFTFNVKLETQEHEVETQISQKRSELEKIIGSSSYSQLDNKIKTVLSKITQELKQIEGGDNLYQQIQKWEKEITRIIEPREAEFTLRIIVRKIKITLADLIINLYFYICIQKLNKLNSIGLIDDTSTHEKVLNELNNLLQYAQSIINITKIVPNIEILEVALKYTEDIITNISGFYKKHKKTPELFQFIAYKKAKQVDSNIVEIIQDLFELRDRYNQRNKEGIDFYPNEETYAYIKNQEAMFHKQLPDLLKKFKNKFVLFENGKVIDYDEDEEKLSERVSKGLLDDQIQAFKNGIEGVFIERVSQ